MTHSSRSSPEQSEEKMAGAASASIESLQPEGGPGTDEDWNVWLVEEVLYIDYEDVTSTQLSLRIIALLMLLLGGIPLLTVSSQHGTVFVALHLVVLVALSALWGNDLGRFLSRPCRLVEVFQRFWKQLPADDTGAGPEHTVSPPTASGPTFAEGKGQKVRSKSTRK